METTTVLISVFLFALVSTGQATKCEDVDMDCGRLDLERNICADPYDAITLCIRYCGLCTDPAHPTVCEDHDVECPTFANQQFCAQEQAKKLCRKTCNFCHNSTVPGSNPGLTVQGPSASVPPPKATHPPPASNGAAMMEIPDPKCHDVDERCSALIHVHNCMTDHLTQMLCQRSCDLCPYVLVSPDSALDAGAKPNITSQVLNTQSDSGQMK
ncbi:uncharacterized protein LOC131941024 [Physella acuta]|uniref:uncharacterized protein LOC131941024 n=1 Tax=Physella acuta TaxID=109671 RepID=UPI0027DCD993|nr:uncharacterized protein LOC131941024 [Physella acuta]